MFQNLWFVRNVLILGKVTYFWALPIIVFISHGCVQKMEGDPELPREEADLE